MKTVRPAHILLKAMLLFALANLAFAIIDPPIERFSLYNSFFPGRLRFPFGEGITDYDLTIDELDAIFASHTISSHTKPLDEWRVIILGDSSIWGEKLATKQTLSSQLNLLRLTCGEKTIQFYNLGYPHPFALKDLVILQRALHYEPDAILWPITLNTIRYKEPNPFLIANHQEAASIVRKLGINYDPSLLDVQPLPLHERTIIGQRNRLSRLFIEQWFGFHWAAGIEPEFTAKPPGSIENDQREDIRIGLIQPPSRITEITLFELLDAGFALAGNIPILLVNEPMFIATGENSHLRYNQFYPRWAYDEYRQIMEERARKNGWNYLDAWNAIPNEFFSDTPLHLTAEGEARLANIIAPKLGNIVCPAAQP
jgi:hypothetical protein